MSGCYLDGTSTKQRIKFLAHEYDTEPLVSLKPATPRSQSQALSHCAFKNVYHTYSIVCFMLYTPVNNFLSCHDDFLSSRFEAADKEVSCSRTQHSDSADNESRISNPSIPNLTLYQMSHCTPLILIYEIEFYYSTFKM